MGILSARFLAVILLVAFLVIAIFVVSRPGHESQDVDITMKKSETFTLGDSLRDSEKIIVSGTLKPIDSATLTAKTSGVIVRFLVEAGDVLKKGDIIVEMENRVLDAELGVAEAEHKRMQAEYKRQVAIHDATRIQAQIGVEKSEIANISNNSTTSDGLEYSYKIAYDGAQQSLSDAIMALIVLSDERYLWKGRVGSGEIIKTTDAQIEAAGILLGADGTSALWNSGYLTKLDGGVRGVLDTMERDQINNTSLDDSLKGIVSGLESIKDGLESLRAIVMLRGVETEVSLIGTKIIQVNTALARITNVEQGVSSARILMDTSIQRQKVVTTQAKQALDDSVRSYETAEISAKRAVESARQRVVYARTKKADAFILAPFNGVVTDKFASLGESTIPGMKIVSIASLAGWKAVFSASDVFNELIAKGALADISINGITGVFTSPVSRIIPSAQSRSRRVRFEVELPELPDATRSGMVATAQVTRGKVSSTKTSNDTMFLVPNRFIGYGYDGAYVITNEGVRISVAISSRHTSDSILIGSELQRGIVLKHPLL